jgi:hypothetical protein
LIACSNSSRAPVEANSDSIESFRVQGEFRAWQGVAIDPDYIYVLTDRNEAFELENIISIYTHRGKRVGQHKGAYTVRDSRGRFMSFGDGNVIEGRLYVTAYNANSGGRPLESRVVIYSLPEVKLVSEHDIGGGVAESVTKHMGSYWVTYHDEMEVRRFDAGFRLIRSYPLSEPMGEYGGYQGAYWDAAELFVQMHGPNEAGQHPSKGLDRYLFDGTKFVFVGSASPLSYGAGQGVAVYGEYVLQNDRPGNSIVVKRSE